MTSFSLWSSAPRRPSPLVLSNASKISSSFFFARVRVSINGDLGRYLCPLPWLILRFASSPRTASSRSLFFGYLSRFVARQAPSLW
ncbi:hypothetical protein DsansV1_C05g0056091 [Dioscorea sansibarensis]